MGRLSAEADGRPTVPEMAQAGKATDPSLGMAGLPKSNQGNRTTVASFKKVIRFFNSRTKLKYDAEPNHQQDLILSVPSWEGCRQGQRQADLHHL